MSENMEKGEWEVGTEGHGWMSPESPCVIPCNLGSDWQLKTCTTLGLKILGKLQPLFKLKIFGFAPYQRFVLGLFPPVENKSYYSSSKG